MNTETIFSNSASEAGWDETKQIQVLLEYIENQQSDEAFSDFLAEAISWEKAIATRGKKPRGWDKALEALKHDEDLFLAEVEVGMFNDSDTQTPFETVDVVVAVSSDAQALEAAQHLVEQTYPVIQSVIIAPVGTAQRVSAHEY